MYDPSGQMGACVQRLTTPCCESDPDTSRPQHTLEATDAEDGAAAEDSVARPTPVPQPSSYQREAIAFDDGTTELDCYPYTFSPLLLFAPGSYFDKGHSNYNSVAQFFSPVLDVNMLDNVLYDRKNMLYEELVDYVSKQQMLVTCCIDSHFTAFQVQRHF